MRRAALALALGAAGSGVAAQGGAESGAALYADFCATCHGPAARGAGPTAPLLTVAMPDLTRLAARNGGVFPMARVLAQIEGRDEVLAHGAPMPFYGGAFDRGGRVTVETEAGPLETPRAARDIALWLESRQRGAAQAD